MDRVVPAQVGQPGVGHTRHEAAGIGEIDRAHAGVVRSRPFGQHLFHIGRSCPITKPYVSGRLGVNYRWRLRGLGLLRRQRTRPWSADRGGGEGRRRRGLGSSGSRTTRTRWPRIGGIARSLRRDDGLVSGRVKDFLKTQGETGGYAANGGSPAPGVEAPEAELPHRRSPARQPQCWPVRAPVAPAASPWCARCRRQSVRWWLSSWAFRCTMSKALTVPSSGCGW